MPANHPDVQAEHHLAEPAADHFKEGAAQHFDVPGQGLTGTIQAWQAVAFSFISFPLHFSPLSHKFMVHFLLCIVQHKFLSHAGQDLQRCRLWH
jgi:hypothetical protein